MDIAQTNNVDKDIDIKEVITQLESFIEKSGLVPLSDINRSDVKGTNGKTYLYNYWMFYGTPQELDGLQAEALLNKELLRR